MFSKATSTNSSKLNTVGMFLAEVAVQREVAPPASHNYHILPHNCESIAFHSEIPPSAPNGSGYSNRAGGSITSPLPLPRVADHNGKFRPLLHRADNV